MNAIGPFLKNFLLMQVLGPMIQAPAMVLSVGPPKNWWTNNTILKFSFTIGLSILRLFSSSSKVAFFLEGFQIYN